MTAVVRLLTLVDLAEDDDGPGARRMSVSVRHEAVLADGRHVVLLDRGWGGSLGGGDRSAGIWAYGSAAEMERTARDVVGPDTGGEGRTQGEVDAGHWASLAAVLAARGAEMDAGNLASLPHDVVLSDRIRARLPSR